jgi:lipopolysaccharide transport system ATP-binding protein
MSNNIAIKVENLSKAYQIGEFSTGTISRDIERWWITQIRGKEDPFLKIGEANDRSVKSSSNIVWSLKDLNFEIQQGDAVGIIGKNGAGKSTLLKLLSRVTAPTTGSIKVKGRIASLLEVGTGFHPELTGRENIFLNGAIMGMRKHEIKSKLDEIIDFSGVERYIDTPVKRYSSGMYVRLAFAVAAHLESEILIVDEVLAVGDAEFQKKCLGKMGDVSKSEGRTILFVSHNMAAIKQLCVNSIILKNGSLLFEGAVLKGVEQYLELNKNINNTSYFNTEDENYETCILNIEIIDSNNNLRSLFAIDEEIILSVKTKIGLNGLKCNMNFRVLDKNDIVIFTSEIKFLNYLNNIGYHDFIVSIPKMFLFPNKYDITFAIHNPHIMLIQKLDNVVSFEILETGSDFNNYNTLDFGYVFSNCAWTHV